MAEIEFWGIGISTIANLGVAIGTGLLAYYTYKSVKASEEQVILARNSIEKPRILEKIHNTLNGIKNEMEIELRAIQQTDMVWLIGSEQNNIYLAPLVFPISPKKEFNLEFHSLFTGPEALTTNQVFESIKRIDENLKKRHDRYRLIDQEFSRLESNIRTTEFDLRVKELLKKTKFRKKNPYSPTPDDLYEFIYWDELTEIQVGSIQKRRLYDIIVSLMISGIFKPLKKDEFRLGCLGFGFLTQELFLHIEKSLQEKPVPESDTIKQKIQSHLTNLNEIDEKILADINTMKEAYRKKYILTDAELDPYQGMW
jgi:hypothetical protein